MGLAVKGHFKYNFWTFLTEPFAQPTSFTSNTRTFEPTLEHLNQTLNIWTNLWTYNLTEQYQLIHFPAVHSQAYKSITLTYIEHEEIIAGTGNIEQLPDQY